MVKNLALKIYFLWEEIANEYEKKSLALAAPCSQPLSQGTHIARVQAEGDRDVAEGGSPFLFSSFRGSRLFIEQNNAVSTFLRGQFQQLRRACLPVSCPP